MTIRAFQDTPATGSVATFNWKQFLKGLTTPWQVLASSDGTTYNAAADIITSGAAGANGMANAFAWFRIRRPGGAGNVEYTLQKTNAASNPTPIQGVAHAPDATVITIVGGMGASFNYLMRGIDNGTGTYTTWQTTTPDPNGAQATAANTTPALVGSIVAGSGIIEARWQS